MMKKKKTMFGRLSHLVRSIPLTDKFLLLFLVLLLVQSCMHLFCYDKLPAHDESIDVMMRSCMATIFGYFMSAGFGNKTKNDDTQRVSAIADSTVTAEHTDTPTAKQIGFVPDQTQPTLPKQTEQNTDVVSVPRNKQQALIVSVVGFVALVVLFVFRMFFVTQQHTVPVISQLQDFIVGSIGFLVGYQKNDVK